MKTKTINEITQTLTKEEIKKHEDLIAECLLRERESIKRGKTTKENWKKISEISNKILESFDTITKECQKINFASQKTDGKVH